MKSISRSLALVLFAVVALNARAAGYPDQPLRLIAPYAPGGNIDSTARLLAQGLSQRLGQPVIVENRPGAAGVVGSEVVAKSKPDGYTMVLNSTGALASAKVLNPGLKLDPLKDFAAAATVSQAPMALIVNPALPVRSVAELIDYARKRPGKLTMASSGIGTSAHLAGEMFQQMTGVKFLHVPYAGSSQAVSDLVAQRVDLTFDQLTSTLPLIKAGKLRALAVTTSTRSIFMPELPTLEESGVHGFEMSTTTGLLLAKDTPPAILDRLNRDSAAILNDPAVKDKMLLLGAAPLPGSGNDFDRMLRGEIEKWTRVADTADIKLP
ncbi:MAG TPA: tripartite tricarboxylate transporter substrate binding protein [Bordetella sp.]